MEVKMFAIKSPSMQAAERLLLYPGNLRVYLLIIMIKCI
jgi:hypothetical protein